MIPIQKEKEKVLIQAKAFATKLYLTYLVSDSAFKLQHLRYINKTKINLDLKEFEKNEASILAFDGNLVSFLETANKLKQSAFTFDIGDN